MIRPEATMHRCFDIASLVSGIFAASTIVLWLIAFLAPPQLSLTRHFHLGVSSGFSGDPPGRLVVFNNAEYGPYRGSIIAISNVGYPLKDIWRWEIGANYGIGKEGTFDGKGAVEFTETEADFPGIYYRYFQWPNQVEPLWTLMLSLWYPFLLFSLLPFARLCVGRNFVRLRKQAS